MEPEDYNKYYEDMFKYIEKLWEDRTISAENYRYLLKWKELRDLAGTEIGQRSQLYKELPKFDEWRKIDPSTNRPRVNEAGMAALEVWRAENGSKYRRYDAKWLSKQYKEIQALSDDDPRKKFYNTLKKYINIAEADLPYTHRLRNRLPGIAKTEWERIAEGQSIKKVVKKSIKYGTKKTEQDIEREQGVTKKDIKERLELLDADDNSVHYLPIHYTAKIDLADQSLDLGTLYYRYFRMGIDFSEKNKILPELEMTKYFIENRDYIVQENGEYVIDVSSKVKDEKKYKEAKTKGLVHRFALSKGKSSAMAEQFSDWFSAAMYGITKKEEGELNLFGYKIDQAKFVDNLNKYTSAGMLGLNVVGGIANINLGEFQNIIESVSGEYFTFKDFTASVGFYTQNLVGILGDVGSRTPKNIVNVINEEFDVVNEYEEGSLRENSKFKKLANWGSMYFMMQSGEHAIQSQVALSVLHNWRAKDSSGKDIGTMLSNLYVKEGRLAVKDGVVNFGEEEQRKFRLTLKRIQSRLHGEYYANAQPAWQLLSTLRMAMLFRKFIVPGFNRRWGKERINDISGDITEGYYRTMGRFVKNLIVEMKALGIVSGTKNAWTDLKPRERANLKRFFTEFVMFASLLVISRILTSLAGGDDDEEDTLTEHLAYQALRLRTELAFFWFPPSAMQILRSPAAAVTMVESGIEFLDRLAYPVTSMTFEYPRYEQGNRKGQLKVMKPAIDLLPGVKQYYRLLYIDDQLGYWNK